MFYCTNKYQQKMHNTSIICIITLTTDLFSFSHKLRQTNIQTKEQLTPTKNTVYKLMLYCCLQPFIV